MASELESKQMQMILKRLMYNECQHDPHLNGFLTILFEGEIFITRRDLIRSLCQPDCSWIFDIEAIRQKKDFFKMQQAKAIK